MRAVGRHFAMRFRLEDCSRRQFDPAEGDVLVRIFRNGTFQLCRVLAVRNGPKLRHTDCVTMAFDDLEPGEPIYREIR